MSIKQIIIQYLEEQGGFVWAGKIDDYIRSVKGSKASNVSRRCRELVKSGVLEVNYEQVEGKGPKCAKYRLTEIPIMGTIDSETEEVKFEPKAEDKQYSLL